MAIWSRCRKRPLQPTISRSKGIMPRASPPASSKCAGDARKAVKAPIVASISWEAQVAEFGRYRPHYAHAEALSQKTDHVGTRPLARPAISRREFRGRQRSSASSATFWDDPAGREVGWVRNGITRLHHGCIREFTVSRSP